MRKIIILAISTILIISCKNQSLMKPDKYGFLQIDDSKIYYESYGQGEPIIFIHAGVTDSRMWNYQINDLSQNFNVILFDQRGFGKSSTPTKNYNPIQDILTLMDSCQIKNANIVGISLGALQAMDLAIEYPERVKTLIISGASFPDWQLPNDILDKHIEFTQYVIENGPDSAVNRMLTDPFWRESIPNEKYKDSRKLFEQILRENKKSFTVDWQLRELPVGLADRLGQVNCPVLIFKPENEMESIKPIFDTIINKVANIKIAEIANTSHLLNMENPDEFNNAIINFIMDK